jgi:hypothetical protein
LTRNISKNKRDEFRNKILAASIKNAALISGLAIIFFLLFSQVINTVLLSGKAPFLSIPAIGLSCLFMAYSVISQSVLFAEKKILFSLGINFVSAVFGALTFFLLITHFGLAGAMWGFISLAIINGVIAISLQKKIRIPSIMFLMKCPSKKHQIYLLPFCISTIFGCFFLPTAFIIVRTLMARQIGWDSVGEWTAVTKISDAYMQFFGLLLTGYALPYFSRINNSSSSQLRTFLNMLSLVAALFFCISLLIYSTRETLFSLVFNYHFGGLDNLLLTQLIADFLRCEFSVIVYFLVSRGKMYIVNAGEIAQGGLMLSGYLLLSLLWKPNGITAVFSYLFVYAILTVFGFIILFKMRVFQPSKDSRVVKIVV